MKTLLLVPTLLAGVACLPTALAEAEVEYEDHNSPSVYVAFAVTDAAKVQGLPADADLVDDPPPPTRPLASPARRPDGVRLLLCPRLGKG